MSKLIDKLRNAARGVPPRMGFGAGNAKAKAPGIGLLADVGSNVELAKQVAGVVDGVVIQVNGSAPDGLSESLSGTIYGYAVADKAQAAPDLKATGADFVVVDLSADAVTLRSDEGAKLLRLPLNTPDGALRAVGVLPVDAILVEDAVGKRLSVDELLNYLRLGAMSMRPIVVSVGPDFADDQLVSLRDASVAAVLVHVKGDSDVAAVQKFREAIDHFPQPPRKDRSDRAMPLVSMPPAPATPSAPVEPDDDD
jgi:hypothetical protein